MVDNNLQLNIWKKLSETKSLIPLRGKVPLERGWQRFCNEKRTFQSDIFIGRNAGIACGPASNCFVLDVDDIDLFDVTCKNNGWSVPATYQVRTGSGKPHFYFQYPANGKVFGNRAFKGYGFDIRGVGGQVVAPGSIHPDTGRPYEVLKELDPVFPPEWILNLYEDSDEKKNNQSSMLDWDGEIDSLPIKADTKDLIKNLMAVGQRSEAIMTVLNALAGAGLSDSDIFSIFESNPIGEKYLEKGYSNSRWLQSQIDKARQYVSNKAATGQNSSFNGDLTPLDIFGDTSLVGKPEWSGEFVPEVIHDFAVDSSQRLGVKTEMIAISALAVAAGAMTDKIKVQPKTFDTTWTESARIWVAVVAEPGQKKTPAIDMALKPLKKVENQFYEHDMLLLEEYENQLEQYERAKKTNKKSDISKPKKPPQRRKIVEDFTIEALCDVLVDNADGVICHRDELSGWLGSFDAYRSHKSTGKDRAAWLELFNGGIRFIDRVKKGRVRIPNWSASLLGGIQPGPMKRLMGKIDDDGLLQRFMVIYGGRSGEGTDRPPNVNALDAYDQLIVNLAKIQPENETAIVKLLPGAQQQRKIVEATARRVMVLPDTSAAFRAHLSKWDGFFARLVLLFHVIEAISSGEKTISEEIKAKTATRCAKFMIDFLLPHAARFYTEIVSGSENLNHARWVAGYILTRKLENISARDIYRAYRNLRGKDQDRLITVMHILTTMGWVKPVKFNKNTNRPSRWKVNHKVHLIFHERAEIEKKRRDEERLKIQEAVDELGLR